MSSGERPIGAAKGKESDTEALCQPPPPFKQHSGGDHEHQGLFDPLHRSLAPACPHDAPLPRGALRPHEGRPAVRGKGTYGGRSGQRVEEQGTWASSTRQYSEADYGRPVDGGVWTANTVKKTPATTSTSSIRQLLGAADAQTAHPATSSTAPAHQPLGSANAETTPARAPAAAADRTQQPNATCEGENG